MSKEIDICFLCDATGSMYSAIADVKENMIKAYQSFLDSTEIDAQVGLALYRDVNDGDGLYSVDCPITGDEGDIAAAVNRIVVGGGGDTPEAQMYALTKMADDRIAIGWRPGSHRIIAWFGDQPGHDPVVFQGHSYTMAEAEDELLDSNIIVLAFSMNPSNRLDSTGQATQITTATGGQLMTGVNQTGVTEFIFDYIKTHVVG